MRENRDQPPEPGRSREHAAEHIARPPAPAALIAPPASAALTDAEFEGRLLEALDALQRFARRRAATWAEAEDLVQATCLRALSKRQLYRHDANFYGWLCTMMVRLQFERISKREREVPTHDWSAIPAPEERPPSWIDHIGTREVEAALEKISEPFREAFELFHLRGLDQKTIAERQGTTPNRISKRVAAARLRLRAVLLSESEDAR